MYYAVYNGREKGIFNTWDECKEKVNGYPNPIYKKFKNKEDAEYFLTNGETNMKQDVYIPNGYNIVFTDGSCKIIDGNKKAGYGIYFGKGDERNISDRFTENPTNNRAELYAILICLEILIKMDTPYIIITDSKYAFDCITKYAKKWEKNDWVTIDGENVKNKEFIKPAYEIMKRYKNIGIRHVNSHTGLRDIYSLGNKEADKLANNGCK